MSTMKTTLADSLKTAMKAREMDKVKVLRGVQAAIKQIEVDKKIELDDAAVLDVLQKQIKQRQESLAVFSENGRDDLAAKEQFELEVIQAFMPKQMTEEEVSALVQAEIAEQGASSMQDMGKVMGALKGKTAGRADPAMISGLVKKALMG
ncbi:GatB/YqeY domain-containing protein [Psychrobacter sp. HD31]|uniref:GatB/YqeY domain-containing protein n=1 Tax=Psychrobacter sp. HD31 TaxID=3112003 RepID=UPI003DA446BF